MDLFSSIVGILNNLASDTVGVKLPEMSFHGAATALLYRTCFLACFIDFLAARFAILWAKGRIR